MLSTQPRLQLFNTSALLPAVSTALRACPLRHVMVMTTSAPSRAKRLAILRQFPWLLPVTNATLPSKLHTNLSFIDLDIV